MPCYREWAYFLSLIDLFCFDLNSWQVILMESSIPHHPLNSWTSFPKHRLNVFTHGQIGVSVPQLMRQKLLVADVHTQGGFASNGQELEVTFDIWDVRPEPEGEEEGRKYTVVFTRCALT